MARVTVTDTPAEAAGVAAERLAEAIAAGRKAAESGAPVGRRRVDAAGGL